MTQKNTAAVWDSVWSDTNLTKNDAVLLAAEAATSRWQRTEAVLLQKFGSFDGKKVLEIGSGRGTASALMAKKGAQVTLLDYSPAALAAAKAFYTAHSITARYVLGDAIELPSSIVLGTFDISISVGVTEHFYGEDRLKITQRHLDVLRPGGLAVVVVPNAYNPFYRIYKAVSELTGTWIFGEEYPYTRSELNDLARKCDAKIVALIGDNFYHSVRYVLPANFLRRWLGVGEPRVLAEVRPQKPTILDDYFGYGLTLIIQKPQTTAS